MMPVQGWWGHRWSSDPSSEVDTGPHWKQRLDFHKVFAFLFRNVTGSDLNANRLWVIGHVPACPICKAKSHNHTRHNLCLSGRWHFYTELQAEMLVWCKCDQSTTFCSFAILRDCIVAVVFQHSVLRGRKYSTFISICVGNNVKNITFTLNCWALHHLFFHCVFFYILNYQWTLLFISCFRWK